MDNLQHQRFELKYLVRPDTALAVRDFVSSYLTLDKFGAKQKDLSYPIHSLYLDSDDFILYWQTINGNKNRYKLRLRYYTDNPSVPVFFEIKRRMNNTILKERGAVKRSAVDALLAGQLPGAEHMAFMEQMPAIENFCRLMQVYSAKPKGHVTYRREAWTSPHDNSARVTMDRQIQFAFEPTARLQTSIENPVDVFSKNVVLELKFTGRFPDWFAELVRCFNLWQASAAKYVDGLTLLMDKGTDFETLAMPSMPDADENLQSRRASLHKSQQAIEPTLA